MRQKKRHISAAMIIGLLLSVLLCIPVYAETYIYDGYEANDIDKVWQEMLSALPEEIREEAEGFMLTEEMDSVQKYFSVSYWRVKAGSLLRAAFRNVFTDLQAVVGMLLLTAVIRQWTGSMTESVFQFCSDACMAVTVFSAVSRLLYRMQMFLEQLCGVMTAMIPVMSAVQYGAGEITGASVNRISLSLFITVLNQLQRWLFMPLGQALCSISILSNVCTQIPLGGFTGGVRKLFTTLFSFMILIYSFVYGMQNLLAKSADSLGLRTVKFAMGSFIPIVGGTVSEAFSAVREGLGYVKIMAGAGGIWILCLLFLPIALSVWSFDIMLSVSHTAAELLGCGQSARLLAETKSILQLFSAILWLSVVFFLFSIILFTKSAGQTI